jgi:hypothetical protein
MRDVSSQKTAPAVLKLLRIPQYIVLATSRRAPGSAVRFPVTGLDFAALLPAMEQGVAVCDLVSVINRVGATSGAAGAVMSCVLLLLMFL